MFTPASNPHHSTVCKWLSATNHGLTLIEVLIATLILGLLTTVTTFQVQRHLERQSLTRTADLIVSHTHNAQNDSIAAKDGKKYGVRYFPDHLETIKYVSDLQSSVEKRFTFPRQITLTRQLFNGLHQDTIAFAKLTGRPDTTGTFAVTSPHYYISITINHNGQITQSETIKSN